MTDFTREEVIDIARKLLRADLRNIDLSDVELSYANLSGANLSGASLHEANLIEAHLPYGPKLYPDDMVAEKPERFFVAELIREAAFEHLEDELPYAINVHIEEFREQERRKTYINAIIYVERESQKGIVIGKGKGGRGHDGQISQFGELASVMRSAPDDETPLVKPQGQHARRMSRQTHDVA